MRLIDADTLKAEFTGNFHEEWHYTGIWATIDVAPTVEAEPVRHGHWDKSQDEIVGGHYHKVRECTECGWTTEFMFDDFYYCPNCGAKMDEESK